MATVCPQPSQTANATTSRDPTGTRQLRQAFIAEMERRMREVRGLVRSSIGYENDALRLTDNVEEREDFGADTRTSRIRAVVQWLRTAIRDHLVKNSPGETVPSPAVVADGGHWSGEFIKRAYVIGFNQATGRLFQRGVSADNPDEESILRLPVTRQQLQRLRQRAFEELETVPEDVAPRLRDTLVAGLRDGENPRQMANRLNEELKSITRDKLATIARTEVINSHSQATLDRYERAGVEVVTHGEWTTAGDDRVCPICQALEGRKFTIQEMRDTTFEMEGVSFDVRLRPPAHPNGRCTILPAVGVAPPTQSLDERLPDAPAALSGNADTAAS